MKTIFHITALAVWEAAKSAGVYEAPSLYTEGFIHGSTRAQVCEVAERLFAGQTGLVLLCIDVTALSVEVRLEPGGEGGATRYPHIYGRIAVAAVSAVHEFKAGAYGRFTLPEGV